MIMSKKIELKLIKTSNGITAANDEESRIDMFEDTDDGRKEFVKYIVDTFLNKEVDGGRKYN